MQKQSLYKYLKRTAYMFGFPLFLAMITISLMPMLNNAPMGHSARNWILVMFSIWAIIEIIRFLLFKFWGNKNQNVHKIAIMIMILISSLAVILPAEVYGAVLKENYNIEKAQIEQTADVKIDNYDNVVGWHRGFTTSDGGVQKLNNKVTKFMSMYDISSMNTTWVANADKENNMGKLIGVYDKVDELLIAKRNDKVKLQKNKEELTAIEAEIANLKQSVKEAEDAYANATEEQKPELKLALDQANEKLGNYEESKKADLIRLKGIRVDISAHKTQIVDLLVKVANDKNILPDGLQITLGDQTINIGSIISTIQNLVTLTPQEIEAVLPDIIYTGIGDETVNTLEGSVKGSSSDISLKSLEVLNFELKWNPQLLALGTVRFASYICIALVVASLLIFDYFETKEKQAKLVEENYEN